VRRVRSSRNLIRGTADHGDDTIREDYAEVASWRYWSDGVGELHLFCAACAAREFCSGCARLHRWTVQMSVTTFDDLPRVRDEADTRRVHHADELYFVKRGGAATATSSHRVERVEPVTRIW
jgi:hypothetical protein